MGVVHSKWLIDFMTRNFLKEFDAIHAHIIILFSLDSK